MSLAQQIQSRKSQEAKREPENTYQPPQLWEDPRPDLADDHHLWQRFLKLACNLPDEKNAFELVGVLNGIRCGGTLLVKGQSGYILRPLIDPKRGWSSQQEYEEMRDKYLKPHQKHIKVLLQVLKREYW